MVGWLTLGELETVVARDAVLVGGVGRRSVFPGRSRENRLGQPHSTAKPVQRLGSIGAGVEGSTSAQDGSGDVGVVVPVV